MKKLVVLVAFVAAMAARADYWMTFCKTPGGQQYAQVGYVKPDADGITYLPLYMTPLSPDAALAFKETRSNTR